MNTCRLWGAALSPLFYSFLPETLFYLEQQLSLLFKKQNSLSSASAQPLERRWVVAIGGGSRMHIKCKQHVSISVSTVPTGVHPCLGILPLCSHRDGASAGSSFSLCSCLRCRRPASPIAPCATFQPGKLLLILPNPAQIFPLFFCIALITLYHYTLYLINGLALGFPTRK